MRKLIPRTAPAAASSRVPASRPAGQRSGEGADSALRGLRDDAAQRPQKAPEPPEPPGPPADGNRKTGSPQQALRPRTARSAAAGASRQRLSRPAWLS